MFSQKKKKVCTLSRKQFHAQWAPKYADIHNCPYFSEQVWRPSAEYLKASEQLQSLSGLSKFEDSNTTITKIQISSLVSNVAVRLNNKLSKRFVKWKKNK